MDLLVVGILAPPAAVGFFGIARSVSRALDMTFRAPAHAFLPSATEAAERGDEELFGRGLSRVGETAVAVLVSGLGGLALAAGLLRRPGEGAPVQDRFR